MPKRKLSDRDARKMVEVKRRCPCITNATLAYAFDISPSRAGEIIRAAQRGGKIDKIYKDRSLPAKGDQ